MPRHAGTAAAICFAKTTNAITRSPTDMPAIASRCAARRQKIPRKNPPRSDPYVKDAIESAKRDREEAKAET